ncbi:peptidoglycan bridge formation glycyltransferase FemA/FemB family protein [Candidatus Gracilibacteria bacterium]|nr:peptidoglycan bridge formation glycyltransferase FemA/FemB family protein [Candidatus Gracilibacteria bacterium]
MDLELFEFSPHVAAEWDTFVIQSSFGSIHQISAWKKFQEQIPGRKKVFGLGVRKNGKIVATVLCVQMQTGRFGQYWWYSARGPVFDPQKEEKAGIFLMQEACKKLGNVGGMFWRVDPYFSISQEKCVFPKTDLPIKTVTQNYQPTDTLIIDLKKTNDEILSEMKRKGRYNITLAQKKGILITTIENGKITERDIDDFWNLNMETTSRDKFSGHEKSYYKKLLQSLDEYAVLFFAEYEGSRIATAISTFCGEKAIYYFGASTSHSEFRNLMAPYLLQWEMMQYAKKRGCTSYDFLGIAPENDLHHPYAGISDFKWKFGGSRHTFSPGQEIVLNPFWYSLYRFVKRRKKL